MSERSGAAPEAAGRTAPEAGPGGAWRWRDRAGILVEWAVWLALALVFYLQTWRFDETIASYRLGATGWPRALAICVAIGATGQMIYRMNAPREQGAVAAALAEPVSAGTWAQRVAIFLLPLAWLWVIPLTGFYVATPLFIIALLLVLEVRSPLAILAVTAVVYGVVLAIFTRFFYVGLPVGQWDGFYEANNWIIKMARWGG